MLRQITYQARGKRVDTFALDNLSVNLGENRFISANRSSKALSLLKSEVATLSDISEIGFERHVLRQYLPERLFALRRVHTS